MATVLPLYLIRQFLIRTAMVTLALAGILLVFDLLGNIVSVTGHNPHFVRTILYYILLRFPAILMLALPLGSLLAAMIVLAKLVRSQEITALFTAGLNVYTIAVIMCAGALAPACVHFLLSNMIVPGTETRLEAWAKNDYARSPPSRGRAVLPAWFAARNDIVQAQEASSGGRLLNDVVIIRRTAAGPVETYYHATEARYDKHKWQLYGVTISDPRTNATSAQDHLTLDMALRPGDLSAAGNSITEMSMASLWRETHRKNMPSAPNPLYRLWLQRKLAEPLESPIMVLLAMPLAFQLTRRNTMLSACFTVIAMGFSYFVAERLMLSLGETVAVPAVAAVWGPPFIFGMMGWWFLLYKQE